jgi:hypothetical protein
MNETLFRDTLVGFGRGVIKVLISLLVGIGVGLLTFGITIRDMDNIWNKPGPPGEFFLAIGVGLLSTGFVMTLLFFLPRLWKAPERPVGKLPVYEEELAA